MNSVIKTFMIIVVANLLATTGDICVTWTSPALPILYSNNTFINPLRRPITTLEDDLITSLLSIGAILGSLLIGVISERFGRKKVILGLAFPHIISFLLLAFGRNIYIYWIARFLAGLSVGATCALLPLYAAEISESYYRGTSTGIISVLWCLGDFLVLVIGSCTSFVALNLILLCFPITFFILFSLVGVESPYYLANLKKNKQAVEALLYLRSNKKEKVTVELETIIEFIKLHEDGKLVDLLKTKSLLKYLLICLFLLTSPALCGLPVILAHLAPIFKSAGLSMSADASAMSVGGVLVVTSFIGPILVDKIGRRPILIVSFMGMCISLCLLGIFFYLFEGCYNVESIKWLPLFSLGSYIVSFNLGVNNVPWTILSELFPNQFKNLTSSICTTAFCLANFIVSLNYNRLISWFGSSGIFWFFSIYCLISLIFSCIFVPETKGKTFSDLQKQLNKKLCQNYDKVNVAMINYN